MKQSDAKIDDHKEPITLKQLSDALGSVTRTEAASSCLARAQKLDQSKDIAASSTEQARAYSESASSEDEHLLESNSDDKSIKDVITISMRGQDVEQAMKYLKAHLLIGVVGGSKKRSLRVDMAGCVGSHGGGELELKTRAMNFLQEQGIQWSEEDQGTTLVIRFNQQMDFRSFLNPTAAAIVTATDLEILSGK